MCATEIHNPLSDNASEKLLDRLRLAEEKIAELSFQLTERGKELNCHKKMAELLANPDLSKENIFTQLVEIIPPSYQFPESTFASMQIEGQTWETPGFLNSSKFQKYPILVEGKELGAITVSLVSEKEDAMHFLPEEETLLSVVAYQIGVYCERHKQNLDLRGSQQQYQQMVETINDAIYEVGLDGIVQFVSPAIEKIVGYTPEELIGTNFFEKMYPEDRPILLHALSNLGKLNFSFLNYRYITRKGEVRWVRSSTNPIYKDGKLIGGRGSLTDIHEQKIIELELQENKERLENLVNSQTNYVLRTNIEGYHTYYNRKFEEDFGHLYPGNLDGGFGLDSICIHHHERVKEVVSECILHPGRIIKSELDKPGRDNRILTTFWEFVCLTNAKGEPSEIQCMGIDITQQKEAERIVVESEQKYRSLFYDSPDAYLIIEDGRFIDCNKSSENLLKSKRDQIIGKTPDQLSPEYQPNGKSSVEYAEELIQKTLEKGNLKFEWVHKRKDGEEFLAMIHLSVMNYNGRQVLFTTWKDITADKEAELHIRKLSQIIEQSPLSIVLTDLHGNVEYVNPATCKITGFTCEEMQGRNPRVFHNADASANKFDELWKTISKGKVWKGEFQSQRKNGEFYWESAIMVPITDASGKIRNYAAIKEDISERKRIEDDLLKFKAVAETANHGIAINELNGDFIFVNNAWAEMHGYTAEELKGKNLAMGHNKEQMQAVGPLIEQLFATGEMNPNEVWHIRKDGSVFPTLMAGSVIYNDQGHAAYLSATCVEITELKDANAKLETNYKKLNAIIEATPDLIFLIDKNGTYLEFYVSGKSKADLLTEENVIGHHLSEHFPPDETAFHISKIKEALQKQSLLSYEYELTINGAHLYYESRLVPVDENAVITFVRDITESKRAEKEILKLSLAVIQSPVLIAITDTGGVLEYVNPAFEKTSGYKAEEVIGQHSRILKSGRNPESMYTELWNTITQGKGWEGEWTNRKKNGEFYWEFATINPIFDANGKIINYLAIKQDITERKRIELEIRELNTNLERRIAERTIELATMNERLQKAILDAENANRAKSEFLASMSHEIRTPMNAILGYSELLGNLIKDKTEKDYLQSIRTSGQSLLTLINDILDLSKIEAGKLDLEYDFVDTVKFFTEFESIFAFKLQENKLKFNTDIISGTPAYLYLDEARLRQVMLNLVGNAVKFTREGDIMVRIFTQNPKVVHYKKDKSEEIIDLIIEIRDTGIGIPEEFLHSIFDSFVQVRSKSNVGGTGLGLPITKRLINLMNGDIKVHSKVGKGSLFTITIPEIPFLRRLENMTNRFKLDPSKISFEKATVLIVDDIEENRRFLCDALKDKGLKLLEAVDGQQAINVMHLEIPDLVITDIRMPQMNGYQLLSEIKKSFLFQHIPVIAYSASVMKEEKERIYNSEFADLLIKPVQISELYHSLTKLLKFVEKEDDKPLAGLKKADPSIEIDDLAGLLAALEGSLAEVHKSFAKRQPIAEIREFGQVLVDLGQKHQSQEVTEYGEELIQSAENFNIEGILTQLARYYDMITQLK